MDARDVLLPAESDGRSGLMRNGSDNRLERSILCFAGEDWWYHHPHEKTHIFKRLAKRGYRILFVNSLTLGLPLPSHPDFFLKIRRKLKSYFRWLRAVPEGFHVMTPLALPWFTSSIAQAVNRVLLPAQIRLAMSICGLHRPVVWVHMPTAASIAEALKFRPVIYQITDKLDANQDSALPAEIIAALDRRLKRLADVVLYNSRRLYDESDAPHRFLITQGVDFDHFAQLSSQAPPDVAAIPHPVLGYFGAMDYVMDTDLIREVLRRQPGWHWAMIGNQSNLMSLAAPNLHFLGARPYGSLPAYLRHFDVCVLPWRDHPFTRYGSAMKVREYLASGKPVVMAPLYEYRNTPGVRFFRNADEFIAMVQDALANDTPADAEARRSVVRHSTWDHKAEQVDQLISTLLERRPLQDEAGTVFCPAAALSAGPSR